MRIGEVCLCTNDVNTLAGFYKTLLNVENNSNDARHQFILAEETTLTVYNDGSTRNNQNVNICLAFTVEDVDAEYERLLALGYPVIDPPQTHPWGARAMHFCDPDGNHLYFRTILDPAPVRTQEPQR